MQNLQDPSIDKRFYGNYRALVVKNNPAEDKYVKSKTAGSVKVRVFGIHDDVSDDALPWAIYADPFMGGSVDSGGLIVPDEGSKIWVFFENGDHNQPVYFAGAPSGKDGPVEKDATYPTNKVFKTKAGFIIEIDDAADATRMRIKQPSGNDKVSDHGGNVTETIVGAVNQTVAKTFTLDVEEGVFIRAPNIQLGEDDAIQQSVLGKNLEDWINNELLPWLNSHQHQGNLGSPVSVAIEPFEAGTAASGGIVWSTKNTNQ
jgi:hypothetical protein